MEARQIYCATYVYTYYTSLISPHTMIYKYDLHKHTHINTHTHTHTHEEFYSIVMSFWLYFFDFFIIFRFLPDDCRL